MGPLHIAALCGQVSVAEFLVEKAGADPRSPATHMYKPEVKVKGSSGRSARGRTPKGGELPLHEAVRGGHFNMVRWLVNRTGVDFRAESALDMALRQGHQRV